MASRSTRADCSNILIRLCRDVTEHPNGAYELSSSDQFLGAPISGLRLTGGEGGESFSIAQPGGVTPTLGDSPADWAKAVAFINDLRDTGLFLEGELNFTRVEDRVGSRPNIVVVQAGSFPALMSLSSLPNIRSIMLNEGVQFSQSYVTNPDPTASLATLLTGQYAHNHGVYAQTSPDGLKGGIAWDGWLPGVADPGAESNTLATWLNAAGYRTGFVGKYLAGYGEVAPQNVSDPATYIPPGWDDWNGLVGFSSNWMYNYTLNENGTLIDYGDSEPDYQTDVLAAKAADFIRSNESKPFFLLVSTSAPNVEVLDPLNFLASDDPLAHLDLGIRPAPRHEYLLDGDFSNGEEPFGVGQFEVGLDMDTTAAASCPRPAPPAGLSVINKPFCVQESPLLGTPEKQRAWRRGTTRQVALRAVDELIAEIEGALISIGDLENTVLLFTAATGGIQGRFNQVGKHLAYEQSIQVPLVVRTPSGVRDQLTSTNAMMANTDIAPTLAHIAGVTMPYEPDGFVRKQAFDGHIKPGEGRDYFLIEHWYVPGFDRFSAPSYLAWRARISNDFPYTSYISTRANPDNFYEVTSRELTGDYGRDEDNRIPLQAQTAEFYDTILEVLFGCEGAVCREYERER